MGIRQRRAVHAYMGIILNLDPGLSSFFSFFLIGDDAYKGLT